MVNNQTPLDDAVAIQKPLLPLAIDIDLLTPDPANARLHDDRNLKTIADSLKLFGFDQPLVAQKSGDRLIVRKGNGRLEAARRLGLTKVPVVIVEEDHVHAVARAIADNRTAELASWDRQTLADLLNGLQENDFPTEQCGFSQLEIDQILPVQEPVEKQSVDLNIKPQILVDCDDERQQESLLRQLMEEGYQCRAV